VRVFARRLLPAFFLLIVLASMAADARAAETAAAVAHPVPRDLVGQVLYVLNPTTVRTRGGGNLAVDLPRGQAVVLVQLSDDRALLDPGPSDAGVLRALGVRKTPRYVATPAQLSADFVPLPAWEKARDSGVRRLLERWPDLTPEQAARIFLGVPYVGMTEEQAEEAVGPLVLSRDPVPGDDGAVAWKVGRRPRSAELRLYNEARERGQHAHTFEEFLATRVRAVLKLRAGVIAAIESPEGDTARLDWP
jgi:hypothetical protein